MLSATDGWGQGRQRPQEGEGASAVPFTASALCATLSVQSPPGPRQLRMCRTCAVVILLVTGLRENGSQFRSVDEDAELPVSPLPSEAAYPEYSPRQTGHPYLNYSRCK